jgi:hypothetical protein
MKISKSDLNSRIYSVYNPDIKKNIYKIENLFLFFNKKNENDVNVLKIIYLDYFANFHDSQKSFDLNIIKHITEDELSQYYYYRYLLLGAQNISILNVSYFNIRILSCIMNLSKILIL